MAQDVIYPGEGSVCTWEKGEIHGTKNTFLKKKEKVSAVFSKKKTEIWGDEHFHKRYNSEFHRVFFIVSLDRINVDIKPGLKRQFSRKPRELGYALDTQNSICLFLYYISGKVQNIQRNKWIARLSSNIYIYTVIEL